LGGTCPGKEESTEQNHSSRSAKGNKYLRRVLNQAADAAVARKGSYFQAVFRRLLPRLGYKSAIWAIAHRLCRVVWKILHERVRFIEQGREVGPREKKQRAQMLARALRKLGYERYRLTSTDLGVASLYRENGLRSFRSLLHSVYLSRSLANRSACSPDIGARLHFCRMVFQWYPDRKK
jgi:hypothetical protein